MISGFRARLMALALLAVAPAFGLQFWEIWREREVALKRAEERVAILARQAAIRQADMIGDTESLLNVIKTIPSIRSFSPGTCSTYLSGIAEARPWIRNLGITDGSGTIVCSINPEIVGLNIADRSYYERAISSGSFVVSDLIIGRVTKRPTVVAVLPAEQFGGTLLYLASLNLSWIEDMATQVATDLNGDIFVVDLNGQIVASHVRHVDDDIAAEAGTLLNDLASDSEGVTVYHPSREDSIVFGYATIPDTTARIFIGLPYTTILNSVYAQTRTGLRNVGITFLMIVVLAWVGGELLLMGPIRRLDITTRKIASGDYGTRAEETRGPTEFRRLGQTFNDMVARLEALADADPLTGLANRRQLDRRLKDLWKRKPNMSIAIAMIDVDHFKHFNDHKGHLRGDECLRILATTLKNWARRADDLAARYGGEEFTLVTTGMTGDEMAAHCERLRKAIEDLAIQRPDGAGHVTVSIGILATTPSACPDIHRAIRLADEALYAAKGAGRNQVIVHRDGTATPVTEILVEATSGRRSGDNPPVEMPGRVAQNR